VPEVCHLDRLRIEGERLYRGRIRMEFKSKIIIPSISLVEWRKSPEGKVKSRLNQSNLRAATMMFGIN
jgi:hypothetical protein